MDGRLLLAHGRIRRRGRPFEPASVFHDPTHRGQSEGSPGTARRVGIQCECPLRKISPVVTNLAAPAGAWIRMEASVVTDQLNDEEANVLVAQLGEDIVSYLRTVSPAQIEGARGLQYLREDLNERAASVRAARCAS